MTTLEKAIEECGRTPAELYDLVVQYEGMELDTPYWPLGEELQRQEKITFGAPRGPGKRWRRAEVKK